MEYRYRIATDEDINGLQKLGLNAYGQFKEILTDENWIKLHAYLTNENTYRDLLTKSVCYVCETGPHIVGMAFFISNGNPTDIFQSDWSYVRMVGVHTDFGGKGIGKKLMQKCVEQARVTAEKAIALHTSEFMDAAHGISMKRWVSGKSENWNLDLEKSIGFICWNCDIFPVDSAFPD